ncbi:Alkaline phosphatase [Pelodictyon phaeoclathratiforme BU-1]|jgi:alkaline phosphatase|uniref:Alkaline phosphatase n=2 Tax=Pelodictyon phaeoclathratiforme TaxID=34090 RepID=B4SAZ0_PELPB|nr:Alkaline phosphatase [Pelodictyon phaeoclathratiforme BU-1]
MKEWYQKDCMVCTRLKIVLLLIVTVSVSACYFALQTLQAAPKGNAAVPRYIFLFIGDGMGAAQVELSSALLHDAQSFTMTSLPVLGMATTHAADRFITDSAAAGTALATGWKTTVGTISMEGNHLDTLRTIAEMAKAKGMKVGIVSSVGIDDATPACFYAHNATRKNVYDIAVQMASSGFDYFGGGYSVGNFPENQAKTKVFRGDIADLMHSSHYVIARNTTELKAVKPGTPCWAYTDYDAKGALSFAMDRRNEEIDLAEFTREGIRLLYNPKGFFMMVEGGKIDWACHANDATAAAHDIKAFEKAIGEAFAFYQRHPGETLLVVTADHECGGLTLGRRANGYETRLDLLHHQNVSQQRFSEKVSAWKKQGAVTFPMALDSVKVYFGPGNVEADSSLALSEADRNMLQEAYTATMRADFSGTQHIDAFTPAVSALLNNRAGIGWNSNAHTAVPVQVFAIGRGAEAFTGFYDNTDIANKIMQIAKLKRPAR